MATKGGSGGGSGAKGVRAGAAYIEIFGDDTKLARMLSRQKANLTAFGKFVGKIGLGLAGAGAGILAPLTALLKGGADRADQIGDIADVFGLTADSASRMASAFEMSGGSIEDLETAMTKLSLSKGANGQPLDEYFFQIAEEINGIADASERMKAAEEIFGSKFARKFIDGSGDVADFVKNAPALTEEQIKNSKRLNIELARTGIVLKSALLPVLSIVGPVVGGFLQFVQANAAVLQVVFAVGAGLVALGSILAVAGFGIAGLVSGAGAVVAVFGLLLTPIGAVVAIVGVLAARWIMLTDSGRAFAGELTSMFVDMGQAFADTWGGIVNALKSGDLELAGRVAVTGLEVVWATALQRMTQAWVNFKNVVVDTWHDATDFIAKGIVTVSAEWTWLTEGRDAAQRQFNDEMNALLNMRDATDATNRAARAGELQEAENRLNQAKAELAALLGKVGAPRGALEVSPEVGKKIQLLETLYGQAQGAQFTPMAGQQFAFGARTTQDAAKDTAKNTAKAVLTLEEIKQQLSAFGVTFK